MRTMLFPFHSSQTSSDVDDSSSFSTEARSSRALYHRCHKLESSSAARACVGGHKIDGTYLPITALSYPGPLILIALTTMVIDAERICSKQNMIGPAETQA